VYLTGRGLSFSVYVYITGSIAHSPHLAEAELIQLEGAVGVLGRDCVAKAATP
jgi:hypothetical protein